MKKINILASILLMGFAISQSGESGETDTNPHQILLPSMDARGWDYQAGDYIYFPTEDDVDWIRKSLPDHQYLYTPGNPYKYQTDEQKIQEYLDDNLEDYLDEYR